MRHVTWDGIRLITTFEGLSLKPYLCPAGVWTIGYGHTGPMVNKDTPNITIEEAEAILQHDLHRFESSVLRLITRPLTDGQFDALVSFTFNLGAGALQRSTLRQKCNRREDEGAAAEFLKWNKIGGNAVKGLTKRRLAESGIYLH